MSQSNIHPVKGNSLTGLSNCYVYANTWNFYVPQPYTGHSKLVLKCTRKERRDLVNQLLYWCFSTLSLFNQTNNVPNCSFTPWSMHFDSESSIQVYRSCCDLTLAKNIFYNKKIELYLQNNFPKLMKRIICAKGKVSLPWFVMTIFSSISGYTRYW